MQILGLDPAINKCGYAIIDYNAKIDSFSLVISGTIKNNTSEKNQIEKIKNIILNLEKIIKEHKLEIIAIEESFVNINLRTSLSMGLARGAIIGLGILNNLKIEEITPKEVKKLITGNGNADKESVQKMLQLIVPKFNFETNDESDALAVAISYIFKNKFDI